MGGWYSRNTAWCSDCQSYYSTNTEHSCVSRDLVANRRKLESWLGSYTIKEGN